MDNKIIYTSILILLYVKNLTKRYFNPCHCKR